MKTLFRLLTLVSLVVGFVACSPTPVEQPVPPVDTNNPAR